MNWSKTTKYISKDLHGTLPKHIVLLITAQLVLVVQLNHTVYDSWDNVKINDAAFVSYRTSPLHNSQYVFALYLGNNENHNDCEAK